MDLKKELRNYYLEFRKKVDAEEISKSILPLFSDWLKTFTFKTFGSYRPIQHLNELNLDIFEKEILSQNKNAIIAYPTVEDDRMNFYTENDVSFFQKNKWNIDEIQNGTLVSAEEFDVIICPLLVCDKKGYRLGYGKGFYDRYLSKVKSNCLKIGIGCFEPIETMPEIYPHDIPLNIYFSPNRVYFFNTK